ncbi:MAG TPA: hypothetical protein DEO95_05525 [Ruminococcaceae bacterium]|nr:hypothetical protein [Oscillospiraceae bacterium]
MAILKCKMCGGTLDVSEGMTVCECEYCGTMQTIPSVDDAKKITLFSRANRLRAACEFDKAASVYENIVGDFPEEAEEGIESAIEWEKSILHAEQESLEKELCNIGQILTRRQRKNIKTRLAQIEDELRRLG